MGLTFVPDKEREDISEIISDVNRWGRRLKLQLHYGDTLPQSEPDNKWNNKNPSKTWTPNVGQVVEEYIEKVKSDIISELSRRRTKNMNKGQKEALNDLMKDESIIIRPADKGSQIVILDIEEYRGLIEKNLENDKTYTQIEENLVNKIDKQARKMLKEYREQNKISPEMEKNLIVKEFRAGKVQGNPKTHKNGDEMRLIINSRGHPTENIAKYVE